MEEPKVVDQILAIPLTQIVANESANCRSKIDPVGVVSLWKSIEKETLLQPVVVRRKEDRFELICGFRRFKAHVVGCAKTINAKVITCSDDDAKIYNLAENLERSNLNLLEEAIAVQKLKFQGWTQDRIAKRFNVTRVWVIGREKLLSLPEAIQQEAAAGYLKMGHVDAICKLDMEEQFKAVREIKERHLRGERTTANDLKPKTPNDVAPKKMRTRNETSEMLQIVMKEINPGIVSRAFAWFNGDISTDDFLLDIKKEKFK